MRFTTVVFQLSTLSGYALQRWTNGSSGPSTTNNIDLSSIGSLGPSEYAWIANNANFSSCYGFAPNIVAGSGGPADSNGDDQIAIIDGSSNIIDIFGVPGQDGSNTCHDFEDGIALRAELNIDPNAGNWNEAGWIIYSDFSNASGCTNHNSNQPQNAADIALLIGDWAGEGSVVPPPPPGPILSFNFCSEEMPLEFNPPFLASAGVMVSDTSDENSGDLGVIGTELGEYVLESVVINVEGGSAQDLLFAIQAPGVPAPWVMGAFAGGTDGTDTAVDLTFTDASLNNYSDWTGGAPAADYQPEDGAFNTALAGLDINGEWFIIVQGNGEDTATVNSFCINWEMSAGEAPEIFCPEDFVADNDEGECGAVVNFTPPIAIDLEDGVLDAEFIVQTGGIETGGFFPVGDNDVTFTATDSHGNETSCTFVITVNDSEAPVAVCQAVTVTLNASGAGSIAAADLDGGSTDNCGVTSFEASQTTFDCSDVGEVTVTLSAIDAAGNVSTCEATVTVVDDIAPVIQCVGGPSGPSVFINEIHYDNAGADQDEFVEIAGPAGFDLSGWSLVLYNGNNGQEYDTVALSGSIGDEGAGYGALSFFPNSIQNGAPDGIVLANNGSVVQFLSYEGAFTALDGIAEGMTSTDIGVFEAGSTEIGFSLQLSGTGAIYAEFTWNEPRISSPGELNTDQTIVDPVDVPPLELSLDADGTVSIPAGDLIMDVDEACGYVVTSGGTAACFEDNPSNGFENGFGIDANGVFSIANDFEASGDFTLTQIVMPLFMNVGATLVDINLTYYEDAGGTPGAIIGSETVTPSSQNVVGSNFGFDISEVTFDVTPFSFTAGTYWVGATANTSDAGSVFWETTTASISGNVVAASNDGGATWAPQAGTDGVTTFSGICGSDDPENFTFDCSNLGENVVEVFVTDEAGNVSSCFTSVIVSDVTAPVLVCGPGDGATTVVEDFDGSSVPAGWSVSNEFGDWDWTFGAPGAGAAGGTEPFSSNAAIFDDDAAGNGNVNNASLLTPVWDMSEATTVTMSYDVSFNELGAGETLTVDVYDGSGWVNVVTYDTDILTPENSGVIDGTALANTEFQVRWTYDDAGSWGWNAGVDNFQITFANPPANQDLVTITLGEDGTAELDAMDFLSEAYDACGIDILIADLEMVTCDDIGAPIEVTVFASDASGNIASCSINVEVVDTMAPVLTCPEDVSVMVDPDGSHTVADYIGTGEATATDNCTDPITDFTQDPAPGTILGVGEWVITFTATDEYGNVSTCDMNLDLTILGNQDNELSNAIVLYPNPANEQVTLSNSSNISLETAMIYDLNGKLISQINLQDMQSERVIDVSSYATGVYMVHITGEQSSVVKRMIKE